MTQHTNSTPKLLSCFYLRSMLLKSMSCIGIFSLLSGNLALAQTEAAIDSIVPTNQNSQSTATAAALKANSLSDAAPAKWQRLRQKLYSAPAKRQQKQTLKQHYSSAAQLRQEQPKTRAVTPSLPTTVRPIVKQQTNLTSHTSHNLTSQFKTQSASSSVKPNSNSAKDYSSAYIDTTDYKIGATTGYEAPKSVVLSERSTGCKAVARVGISGSICGTVTQRRMRVAGLGHSQARGWLSKNRSVASGIRPIQVGPISVSANGFRVATNTATKRSVLSYYSNGKSGNAATGFMFPLTIPAPITSLFGWRIHPITGDRRFHAGTDLGAPLGTPVLAAYPGSVAIADYLGGYGLTVVLDHNKYTQQTLYGHLSEIFVQPGEWVKQGTVIGRVGSTGNSTGPHLHFETRQLTSEGWVATDPGVQIENAFAQLVKALKIAHSNQKPGNRV